MKTKWKAALSIAAALALAGTGTVASASASPAVHRVSVATESTDDTYGITDPVVLDKLAEIRESGAEVISVAQAPYEAEAGDAAARALPSGCGLTVIVSRSGRVIDGGSITSCNFPFTAGVMTSTMTHYNPDWGIWDSTVATGRDSLTTGTIMTVDVAYNCKNGNASNYRLVSTGQLVRGSTTYSAAAYDTFDKNQPCGT